VLIFNSGSGIFTSVLFEGNTANAGVGQTVLLFIHIRKSIYIMTLCIMYYVPKRIFVYSYILLHVSSTHNCFLSIQMLTFSFCIYNIYVLSLFSLIYEDL